MKGLHLFLNEKRRDFAVRFNADIPSYIPDAVAKDPKGRECRYALLSLPLYMVGQLERLIRHVLAHRDLRIKPHEDAPKEAE